MAHPQISTLWKYLVQETRASGELVLVLLLWASERKVDHAIRGINYASKSFMTLATVEPR
jgi:hypothetical protein